jgi:hypothetical protein
MSNPWEHPDLESIWKTKSSFMSYIRSCLRKAWNRHPAKIIVLRDRRKKIPNPSNKGKLKEVWGFDCPLCNRVLPIREGQVDHINAAGSLRDKEDIQSFVEKLVWVTPDDLRLICKSCNSALSYADRQGISFEEAVKQKEIIARLKQSVDKQKKELLAAGFSQDGVSNAEKRRECYRRLLNGD